VPRNRLKRILRESYRSLRPSLTSDCMVILVGRKEALAVSKVFLDQALCVLFRQAGIFVHA
jgi:RNase P protein component